MPELDVRDVLLLLEELLERFREGGDIDMAEDRRERDARTCGLGSDLLMVLELLEEDLDTEFLLDELPLLLLDDFDVDFLSGVADLVDLDYENEKV